jgi:hypothetical protein
MRAKTKESARILIISLTLSVVTALVSFILLFLLGFLFHALFGGGLVVRLLTYCSYNIFIAAACFFICRNDSQSIWYAPVICSATSINGAVSEPDFWGPFILYVVGWVVTLSGGIIGSVLGRHRAKQV